MAKHTHHCKHLTLFFMAPEIFETQSCSVSENTNHWLVEPRQSAVQPWDHRAARGQLWENIDPRRFQDHPYANHGKQQSLLALWHDRWPKKASTLARDDSLWAQPFFEKMPNPLSWSCEITESGGCMPIAPPGEMERLLLYVTSQWRATSGGS